MLGKGKHLALEVENLRNNEIKLLIHDCTAIQWQEQEIESNRADYNIVFFLLWGILRCWKTFCWADRGKVKPQLFHRTQTALFFSCPPKRTPSQEKQGWGFQLTIFFLEEFLSPRKIELIGTPWAGCHCLNAVVLSDSITREKKDGSLSPPWL